MGHVQDENGQKMSKSKGNAVDPFDALNTYGADSIRWYFYTAGAPWLPEAFPWKGRTWKDRESSWELCGTPTLSLYCMQTSTALIRPSIPWIMRNCPVMDKWLLSKMNTMVKRCG